MSVFAELNELRRLCDAPPHYFQHWTVGAHYDGTPRYGTAPPPDDTAPPPGDTSDDGNPPPGITTKTFAYNAANRMASVSEDGNLLIDSEGRRLA